jgi:hypothetical protein
MQFPTFTFEQLLVLYVINQVSSALVQSLAPPQEGGNQGYAFFYRFLTLLVGDFKSFMSKIPAPGTAQVIDSAGVKNTVPEYQVPVSAKVLADATKVNEL